VFLAAEGGMVGEAGGGGGGGIIGVGVLGRFAHGKPRVAEVMTPW